MKKVLFATSALVALAGAAHAEVAVTGDGYLGLRYQDNFSCPTGADVVKCDSKGWNVVNRARVKFTMTGTTDSGLEFGASLRADTAKEATASLGQSAYKGTVWISGTYGKLTAGDIDGAIVQAVGHLPYVGVSELDDLNEFFYSNSDLDSDIYKEAALLYEYTFNGVKLYASFMDQYVNNTGVDRGNDAYSFGASYEWSGWQFGAGWERGDRYQDVLMGYYDQSLANNTIAVSARGAFGGAKVTGIIAQTKVDPSGPDNDYKVMQYGLGAEYKLANGVGLVGYYRHIENDSVDLAGTEGKADVVGLGAQYDLGGGATVKGGIVNVSAKDGYDVEGVDRTMADFGVSFKF